MSGNVFWRQHGDTWARRSEHGLPNAAYDRPAIFRQLRGAGFTVDVVDEPQPETAGEPSDPELMHILQTQPIFLFIRALRA